MWCSLLPAASRHVAERTNLCKPCLRGGVVGYAGLLDLKQSRIHACNVRSAGIHQTVVHQTLERVESTRILLERGAVRISECAIDLHT